MTQLGTDVYTVDGVLLNTYAWNITTFAGRSGLPPKVGENIRVPFRQGRIWKPKTYDQRTETLAMWVDGCTADGLVPTAGARAAFNDNLRALKRLFAPRSRQLSLTRALTFTAGQETHTALGEVGGTIEPTFDSASLARFSVDLILADPWWYGTPQSTDVTSAGATITNPGDVESTKMTIALVGPLTNPRLRNTSVSPAIDVRYTGSIGGGQTVTLDCDAFTAKDLSGSSVIGLVSHVGSTLWMLLEPGSNVMTLDRYDGGVVGAGKATVAFSPPYA